MGGAAVLDKETGLVWEKSRSPMYYTWADAQDHCNNNIVAERKGWRLPAIQELACLMDMHSMLVGATKLPIGHPFGIVSLGRRYWSATTNANDSTSAWAGDFFTARETYDIKTLENQVWCVRGGQGYDAQ